MRAIAERVDNQGSAWQNWNMSNVDNRAKEYSENERAEAARVLEHWTPQTMGGKGGSRRSERKRLAALKNLAKANAEKAKIANTGAGLVKVEK